MAGPTGRVTDCRRGEGGEAGEVGNQAIMRRRWGTGDHAPPARGERAGAAGQGDRTPGGRAAPSGGTQPRGPYRLQLPSIVCASIDWGGELGLVAGAMDAVREEGARQRELSGGGCVA